MTPSELPSGTDRVAYVAKDIEKFIAKNQIRVDDINEQM